MPYYVFLNFEDADPVPSTGVVTGTKSANPAGIGAAASGTLNIYKNRADDKSKWYNSKHVKYYPCQELIARDAAGTLPKDDVEKIRADCAEAKTVAIVIHGRPDDTDNGFSSGGNQVCTWQQLGKLALLLFPDAGHTYNIALIMCYGARSTNAMLDHRGNIPVNDLKTSFAYKFFRSICVYRNVRMTARTGAVSNDANLAHTVETEEQVFAVVDKMNARAERNLNKATMDAQKNQYLTNHGITAQQFDQMMYQFVQNPNRLVANADEQFAKDYIPYSNYVNAYIDATYGTNNLGNRNKFGKFVYTYNGVLQIVSRYDTGNGPNYVLYNGPLI